MTTLRTHFTFRVDTWTPDGESIVEHIAGIEDYQVALATFRAACERWPGTPITLRARRRGDVEPRLAPRAGANDAESWRMARNLLFLDNDLHFLDNDLVALV